MRNEALAADHVRSTIDRLRAGAAALLCGALVPLHAGELIELSAELRKSGSDYEDPCFWQDPVDPALALGCITSQGQKQVECFNLTTKEFAGAAGDSSGGLSSCDVDDARNEMVSTHGAERLVLVHALPSLELLRKLTVPKATDLAGICVLRDRDRSLVVVTDEAVGEVIALDSETGQVAWRWLHGLTDTEGVACDDERKRLILCDDESGLHGCQAFSYDGQRAGAPFGGAVLGPEPEGVAIYRCPEGRGYVVVADPDQGEFEVFRREDFQHACTFSLKSKGDLTNKTDGIDILQSSGWPAGLLGACDDCSSKADDQLDIVSWSEIAAACNLEVCAPPAREASTAPARRSN